MPGTLGVAYALAKSAELDERMSRIKSAFSEKYAGERFREAASAYARHPISLHDHAVLFKDYTLAFRNDELVLLHLNRPIAFVQMEVSTDSIHIKRVHATETMDLHDQRMRWSELLVGALIRYAKKSDWCTRITIPFARRKWEYWRPKLPKHFRDFRKDKRLEIRANMELWLDGTAGTMGFSRYPILGYWVYGI